MPDTTHEIVLKLSPKAVAQPFLQQDLFVNIDSQC